MFSQHNIDPFSSKGLLKIERLQSGVDGVWHGFEFTTTTDDAFLQLADLQKPHVADLDLDPQTLRFGDQSLTQIDQYGSISESDTIDSDSDNKFVPQISEPEQLDIWRDPLASIASQRHDLLSWDRFTDPSTVDTGQKYLTETTEDEYNALWHELHSSRSPNRLRLAHKDQFNQALVNLLLGRDSTFFKWDEFSSKFVSTAKDFTLSGYSPSSTAGICNHFAAFGSVYRNVRLYCSAVGDSHPTGHAFRSSLTNLMHDIELYVVDHIDGDSSFLQIQQKADNLVELFACLEQMVLQSAATSTELEYLTAILFGIDKLWNSVESLKPILSSIAAGTAQPALQQTYAMMGITNTQIRHQADWLLSRLIPYHTDTIANAVACVLTMQNTLPTKQSKRGTQKPLTQLAHTWSGLLELQIEAERLEKSFKSTPESPPSPPHLPLGYMSLGGDDALSLNPFVIDFGHLPSLATLQIDETCGRVGMSNKVFELLETTESNNIPELSPIQSLQLSLDPLIQARNRECSYLLMRVLFLQRDLVMHLDIIHAFLLFGNGTFAVRLSRALFAADQQNPMDRNSTGLTTGLRLHDREIWPPASSELRLVLMGLLTESAPQRTPADILDCISFSIRDMSDAEANLCRDVHSIHALDFLRLAYTPTNVTLETVITTVILDKYDQIFNFLLLLLRMHSLSQGILTESRNKHKSCPPLYRKFCIKTHHFTSVLIDFAMNTAVELPWREFRTHVASLSMFLQADNYEESMKLARSVAHLCRYHETMLDEVMKALMLQKREKKALEATIAIFAFVLEFAATVAPDAPPGVIARAYNNMDALVQSWTARIRDICDSTSDRALLRLEMLLLRHNMVG